MAACRDNFRPARWRVATLSAAFCLFGSVMISADLHAQAPATPAAVPPAVVPAANYAPPPIPPYYLAPPALPPQANAPQAPVNYPQYPAYPTTAPLPPSSTIPPNAGPALVPAPGQYPAAAPAPGYVPQPIAQPVPQLYPAQQAEINQAGSSANYPPMQPSAYAPQQPQTVYATAQPPYVQMPPANAVAPGYVVPNAVPAQPAPAPNVRMGAPVQLPPDNALGVSLTNPQASASATSAEPAKKESGWRRFNNWLWGEGDSAKSTSEPASGNPFGTSKIVSPFAKPNSEYIEDRQAWGRFRRNQ